MKRWLPFGVAILLAALLLSLTPRQPDPFAGEWYGAENGCVYLFQEGILSCAEQFYTLLDGQPYSGAYIFCEDYALVFAAGIPELAQEREVYLVKGSEGLTLCLDAQGNRPVLIRSNSQ